MSRHAASFTAIVSALGFSATVASAADIAPAAYDWSGFYFGANAGAAWSNATVDSDFQNTRSLNQSTADSLEESIEDGDPAFTGGGSAGYNWQYGSLMLGVEADFGFLSFGDSIDKTFNSAPDFPNAPDYNAHLEWDASWFGTVRGRVGFAADNLLIYGTGGLAYGDVEASGKASLDGNVFLEGSADDVQWGWTAGAGVELALDESWSIGAEYLYVDLGSTDFNYEVISGDFEGETEIDYRFSVARATLKFRL